MVSYVERLTLINFRLELLKTFTNRSLFLVVVENLHYNELLVKMVETAINAVKNSNLLIQTLNY